MHALKRDPIQLLFMNVLLATSVLVVLIYDPKTALQLMALVGATWLGVLLIVPRLLYNARFARWQNQLLHTAKQSKWLGTWTALWFAAHAITATVLYSAGKPLWVWLTSRQVLLGALSLVVLFILLAISNQWSYAHVKYWKHINMLVWAVPLLALAHSLLAAPFYRGSWPLLFIAPTLFAIAALAGGTVLFAPTKKKFDWWRLWLLVGSGALALVVVLWQ